MTVKRISLATANSGMYCYLLPDRREEKQSFKEYCYETIDAKKNWSRLMSVLLVFVDATKNNLKLVAENFSKWRTRIFHITFLSRSSGLLGEYYHSSQSHNPEGAPLSVSF